MAKKPVKKTPAYKGIGGGAFKVTDRKSGNFGKTFTKDAAGNHVYKLSGGKTKTVGKRTVPYDPTAPIATQQEFNTRVDAAANLKYGQSEADLTSQTRVSQQAQANKNQWYQDYQKAIGDANARQAANTAQTQQAIYGQANTMAAGANQQSAQLDQAAQVAAALRGTTAAPSAAPQAAQAAQGAGSAFGGLVGAQGNAQQAYGASQYGTAAGQRVSALSQEAANQRKIGEARQKQDVEKGAFKVQYGTDLRQKESDNALARSAYNLNATNTLQDNANDQQKIVTTAKTQAAKIKADKRKAAADRAVRIRAQKVTERGQTLSHQDRLSAQRIAAQKKAAKDAKGTGMSAPGYGKTGVTKAKSISNRAQWEDLINTPGKAPPKSANAYMVKVAKEYYSNKHKVSPATAKKVYRLFGFRLPKYSTKVGQNVKGGGGKVKIRF